MALVTQNHLTQAAVVDLQRYAAAVTNDVTPPLLTGFAGRDSSLVYGDTIALTLLLHPDPP